MNWKSVMKSVASRCLLNDGFKQHTLNTYERALDGFFQGVCFRPGRKWLKGRFAVDYYLRYDIPRENGYGVMDVLKTSFSLEDENRAQAWFDEKDPQSVNQIIDFYNQEINPFFLEYNSLNRIITAYESNENEITRQAACDVELKGLRWFGISLTTQLFVLGFVYIHLGEIQKGINVLTQLINNEDYDLREHELIRNKIAATEIEKRLMAGYVMLDSSPIPARDLEFVPLGTEN
jgi:hypothetical protein